MFFVRKLDPTLISLFYRATIETILTFCLSAWGGNATAYDLKKLNRVIMKAKKVCQSEVLSSIEELLERVRGRKIESLMSSNHHPLSNKVEFSKRTGRAIVIKCRTERYRRSFLPRATLSLANSFIRK